MLPTIAVILIILLFLLVGWSPKRSHFVAKVNIKLPLEKCFESFINPNLLQKWIKGYKPTANEQEIFLDMCEKSRNVSIISKKIEENKEIRLKIKTNYFIGESWYKFYARNSTETLVVNLNIWKTNSYKNRLLFYLGKNKISDNLNKNLETLKVLIEKTTN
jgi:hypothetical protein